VNAAHRLTEIPVELKALPNWVAWKLVERDGSLTKPPFIVGTNRHASSTDPSTWTTYEAAVASVAATGIGKENGLGFAIGGAALDLNLIAIDIDGCRNTDGTIAPWADELLTAAGGYTEITPSETGLRIIGTGKLRKDQETFDLDPTAGFGKKVKIECFADKKYITVTGEPLFEDAGELESLDMPAIYAVIDGIQKKHPVTTTKKAEGNTSAASSSYMGGVQIEHTGGPFTTHYELFMNGTLTSDKPCVIDDGVGNSLTYPSHSEADLAFANHAALEHGDNADAIWADCQASCLYRKKWERDAYRKGTIAKGIEFANKFRERTSKVSTSTDATVNQIGPVPPVEDDLEETVWPDPRFAMTQEELDAQDAEDVEHPIWKLRETAGPNFDDALLYGPLGDVTQRLCEFSEANSGAVYLNLLVSFGSMIGRQAYFNVGATRHYLNEFLACVGSSSIGRKGTASDVADSFLHLINAHWLSTHNVTGFSTPQAVISQIKDASVFKKFDKVTKEYSDVEHPGVEDKRLCIREGELSNVFKLMSDPKTKAAELIRNLWDGKGVSNIVAGKSADGENNSLQCKEPHVSIIGSSTPSLVKSTMPVGAALSGDGNRFLWCYVKRTQLAPQGGRPVDCSKLYTTHVDGKGKKREISTFVC
jgi:putative DNA primase/helicase